MDYSTLKLIAIAIIVFGALMFLFKSLIKAIIITIVIVTLFRVGWVYTSDDLKNKLHLGEFVNPSYVESLYDGYDDYVNKRDKDNILDAKKIDNNIQKVDDSLRKEISEKVNQYLEDKKKPNTDNQTVSNK